jgi:hypothetical protein
MKAVMIVLGGSVLAVTTFIGGMVSATAMLTTRSPVQLANASVSELWTTAPVKVDKAAQSLERVAARPLPLLSKLNADLQAGVRTDIGASEPNPGLSDRGPLEGVEAVSDDTTQGMTAEHLEWCASRYRSYRPRDNSYTPFSGGRRQCKSPYVSRQTPGIGDARAISEAPDAGDSFEEPRATDLKSEKQVADIGRLSNGDPAHVQSCFARYRSYRIADNTYQPVSGGPRRQCQ